jgi:cytochrome c oxidase subunit 4
MSHISPKSTYYAIFGALMALTALTVYVAFQHLGWLNFPVAISIAFVKASLVVLFFMHLKYEQRWWASIVLFPVLLVFIIIGSNLPDTGLNGKNRDGDLLSEPLPVIPHAGKAGPAAPAHH